MVGVFKGILLVYQTEVLLVIPKSLWLFFVHIWLCFSSIVNSMLSSWYTAHKLFIV